MTAKYQWIGRRIRHLPAPVGDHLHVNAHQSAIDTRNCYGIHEGVDHAPDMVACKCGTFICSQRGPCAPKPVDVLPDWWREVSLIFNQFRHESGASVWSVRGDGCWYYALAGECLSTGTKPTRAEAMQAALASVEPAKASALPGSRLDLASAVSSLSPEDRRTVIDLIVNGGPTSAEPALRPGWRKSVYSVHRPMYVHESLEAYVFETDLGEWTVAGHGVFPDIESACIRAEELAAARGVR